MATIQRLPSGSYRARVYIGDGKYKSITGTSKKEVQLQAAQFEAQKADARASVADITVCEAIEGYIALKEHVLSPSTLIGYNRVKQRYRPELMRCKIADVTQIMLQREVNTMAATVSPKTVRNRYGLLLSAIRMYRDDLNVKITLPQKIKTEIVIPTEADVMAILNHAKDTKYELPIMFAAFCGLRMSEITGLKWACVDFNRRMIRIEEAIVLGNNNEWVSKGTKSVAGQRMIKILPQVYDKLMEQYNINNKSKYVVKLTNEMIYKGYKRIQRECLADGESYRFHDLRHYCASVMIMLGIPIKYIADYLGHETDDMVNRVYGHIMRDKTDDMFARVEAYYNGVINR